jgi:uncharacterized protein
MKHEKIISKLRKQGLTPEQEEHIRRELETGGEHFVRPDDGDLPGFYQHHDLVSLQGFTFPPHKPELSLRTLDDLMEQDKRREEDGFPRRIRLGKMVKPVRGKKSQVVVVPTTSEPKFYHDDSITEDGEGGESGGSGEGEEGDVIAEKQAEPEQGEGDASGAGQGEGSDHDVSSEAFDLGRILTQRFQLPNIKEKGKKRSITKYTYDLTDRNRGFGQVLDKKETLRRVVGSNILLGNIKPGEDVNPEDFLVGPKDLVYRILSPEKDFENQAVVFFVRDYSGSMQGKPTEAVSTQHLLIYSWLMYQYQGNVLTRFIVHDTEAKEVPDFYTYYSSQVAGGTQVAPAFALVNKIIETEQLSKDYNIYVFYGTDGDDWDNTGKEMLEAVNGTLLHTNRLGITIARNSWSTQQATTVEKNLESSGLLQSKADLIRMYVLLAESYTEETLIEGIKHLIS